jgi:hypothetical protein
MSIVVPRCLDRGWNIRAPALRINDRVINADLTLAYFVPRDLILFTWSIPDHLEQIRTASAQWNYMNWLRSLLGLAGVLFSFKGLDTYYATRGKVGA